MSDKPSALRRVAGWLRGEPVDRRLKSQRAAARRIERGGGALVELTDEGLQARMHRIRTAARAKPELATADREEAIALVREASHRVLGLRPYDEQVLASLALSERWMVEMRTGEGKTLAAVAPALLSALTGRGSHVLTFNDYLARRDAAWMGPVYAFFGLTVGAVQSSMAPEQRRSAWAADVTYATAREAGFDLLRDELCAHAADRVGRPPHAAIVDEADSIMIDEARIPLVVAGRSEDEVASAASLARLVEGLEPGRHYDLDEHANHAFLTEAGNREVEQGLGIDSLHDGNNADLLARLHVALRAHALLKRDVDYIVRDGRVELVDEFTGRAVEDRRWPDGLHPALLAKEGLEPEPEGRVLASLTLQHFLRGYPQLSGMTATVTAAAEEVHTLYGMRTAVIPPHVPSIRTDEPDRVYATRAARERALVRAIGAAHEAGRPVLVGTVSVEESERLTGLLREAGLTPAVLNARNDENEAVIVADAGALGAVTISTNMAGRGTDIRLGGSDERQRDAVLALGGLYVIGTNRHESRRVDDQLRGRAGRQGDPGSSRFFISLQDPTLVRYGLAELLPPRCRELTGDEPVDDVAVSREVARAQRIIESEHFTGRRLLFKYSNVVEHQRQELQQLREPLLAGPPKPSLLREEAPERWRALVDRHGEEAVAEAERLLALRLLDRAWSEQLATVAAIREGIHLEAAATVTTFGSTRDPLPIFHRKVGDAWGEALDRWNERWCEAAARLELDEQGRLVEEPALRAPASTWVYVINDDPYGELLSGLGMALGRMVRRSLKLDR
jgi:preprotein translocase subunit SecA